MIESDPSTDLTSFIVKPEAWVQLHYDGSVTQHLKIKVTYLPIDSNISITGHKHYGKTMDHLIINSWAYMCAHWIYVILSRVRSLNSLILDEKFNKNHEYDANNELVRW